MLGCKGERRRQVSRVSEVRVGGRRWRKERGRRHPEREREESSGKWCDKKKRDGLLSQGSSLLAGWREWASTGAHSCPGSGSRGRKGGVLDDAKNASDEGEKEGAPRERWRTNAEGCWESAM